MELCPWIKPNKKHSESSILRDGATWWIWSCRGGKNLASGLGNQPI